MPKKIGFRDAKPRFLVLRNAQKHSLYENWQNPEIQQMLENPPLIAEVGTIRVFFLKGGLMDMG